MLSAVDSTRHCRLWEAQGIVAVGGTRQYGLWVEQGTKLTVGCTRLYWLWVAQGAVGGTHYSGLWAAQGTVGCGRKDWEVCQRLVVQAGTSGQYERHDQNFLSVYPTAPFPPCSFSPSLYPFFLCLTYSRALSLPHFLPYSFAASLSFLLFLCLTFSPDFFLPHVLPCSSLPHFRQ